MHEFLSTAKNPMSCYKNRFIWSFQSIPGIFESELRYKIFHDKENYINYKTNWSVFKLEIIIDDRFFKFT